MIIYDLYLFRMATPPDKAKPPLIIDTNAMLSFAIPLQGFQLIGRGKPQILQLDGSIDCVEPLERSLLNIVRELPHELTFEDSLGISIMERSDHAR